MEGWSSYYDNDVQYKTFLFWHLSVCRLKTSSMPSYQNRAVNTLQLDILHPYLRRELIV